MHKSLRHNLRLMTAKEQSKQHCKIVSLFSGCGGLDLGFKNAGFQVIWANEYDKDIWETYEYNHQNTILDHRSITNIHEDEIPECDGIIGGPPCQSWSAGGSMRGLKDNRGKLFFDYIRILKAKRPKFFLAENVKGMLLKRHSEALSTLKAEFKRAGYDLYFNLLNAANYSVPQDRYRVFFVGFRSDLGLKFTFPSPTPNKVTLRDAIGDLSAYPPIGLPNGIWKGNFNQEIKNHEYMTGGFSPIYMSRNRVRSWDEVSYTIQASGRQAPIHPQAPKMEIDEHGNRFFKRGQESVYRRLSVREVARIQTFPDDFIYFYKNINAGYKMIGNAVPVNLAYAIAGQIKETIKEK